MRKAIVAVLAMALLIGMPSAQHIGQQRVEQSTSFPAAPATAGPDGYTFARNYSQLVGWYRALEQRFPGFLETFKANELYGTGRIAGGYDCWYVRITNESRGPDKPEALFLGSPHGVEKIGTTCLYWFTDWLMRMAYTDEPCPGYDKAWLRWLIDHREIYIEISHNPWAFDHNRRWDHNGWDLNREADYNGPGEWGPPSCWRSVPGKTLVRFVNNHTVRVGCDFHEGLRKLMYPWFNSHWLVKGVSPITWTPYNYAPPDFYFYDAASVRAADYLGDFGGDLAGWDVGPITSFVDSIDGALVCWAYGSDVASNPREDRYVNDEANGGYPGAGIMWHLYEVYDYEKHINRWELLGNDTALGFGMEIRRYLLHQIDLAQPYVRWTAMPDEHAEPGTHTFRWQVNGSLVVDHTMLHWGSDPDPISNYSHTSEDHDRHAGDWRGGTGWHNAMNGSTQGMTYSATLSFDQPGDYYVVAKAQVDQRYGTPHARLFYGSDPYLRLVKERTDPDFYEARQGTDGLEEVQGRLWWYSPVVHVHVE